MSAPRLSRRLLLESKQRLDDGSGGYSEVWVALGELWAEVTSRTGREINDAGLTMSSVSYRIVVRASPHGSLSRPVPEQRFREGARVYLIQAVTEFDQDGRYVICFADEELVA